MDNNDNALTMPEQEGEIQSSIESMILNIRGQQVILDRDLARHYGVETKALNQAVKRNINRFPERFRDQLSKDELLEVVTNCDLKQCKFDIAKCDIKLGWNQKTTSSITLAPR